MKAPALGWQLLLTFVLSLSVLAGLIGWLQNVNIITGNGDNFQLSSLTGRPNTTVNPACGPVYQSKFSPTGVFQEPCINGFVAAGVHAVLYVMLAGAINAVAHQYGDRPYKSSATNVQPLALVTGGEGLHNNHHAAPTSARFSLHEGEIDPGWWVVRVLVALHLARVRHDDVHLKSAA